jgi:nucleoid-associated protein YgaU
MRPEMRLGLVVFAMLIAGVGIIYFTMQGGETGEVPVNNPNANPDPTPASDTEAVIPNSRSTRTRSSTPSVSNSASGSRTATPGVTPGIGDQRPSIAQRNAAGRSSDNPTANSTNSGNSARRSPESAVVTPGNTPFGGDEEDSQPTQTPPTRPSSTDEGTTTSRDSANDRPADRDAGPVTTPSREDSRSSTSTETQPGRESGSDVELLRPVEDRSATREADRPETRRESPATSGSTAGRTHTVTKGERLWDLAAAEYGDGKYWGVIARANPDIDPDRLLVGQKLKIPPKSVVVKPPARSGAQPDTNQPETAERKPEPKPEKPEPKTRIYTVEAGDSLIKIADALYADKERWREIYELNRDQLKKPNLIRPGMKLKVPPL